MSDVVNAKVLLVCIFFEPSLHEKLPVPVLEESFHAIANGFEETIEIAIDHFDSNVRRARAEKRMPPDGLCTTSTPMRRHPRSRARLYLRWCPVAADLQLDRFETSIRSTRN